MRNNGTIKTAYIYNNMTSNLINGYHGGNGTIETAYIKGGYLCNRDADARFNSSGTIGTAYFEAGVLENNDNIDELHYKGGTYRYTEGAKIGTLYITEAAYNAQDWGTVGKVVFVDKTGDMLWDFTNEDNTDAGGKIVCLEEVGEIIWNFTDEEMLFDDTGVEHAVVITSDNDNVDRWVHTTKCENPLGHDYDFDNAVQDEHGNWWVECQDCGYWGLWIDGEVI